MCLASHERGGPYQCGKDSHDRAAAAETRAAAAEQTRDSLNAELEEMAHAAPADTATLIAGRPDLERSIRSLQERGATMTLTRHITDSDGQPMLVVLNGADAAKAGHDLGDAAGTATLVGPDKVVDDIAYFPDVRAVAGSDRIVVTGPTMFSSDDLTDLAGQLRGATQWLGDTRDDTPDSAGGRVAQRDDPPTVRQEPSATTTTWPSGLVVVSPSQDLGALPRVSVPTPPGGFTRDHADQLIADLGAAGPVLDAAVSRQEQQYRSPRFWDGDDTWGGDE